MLYYYFSRSIIIKKLFQHKLFSLRRTLENTLARKSSKIFWLFARLFVSLFPKKE